MKRLAIGMILLQSVVYGILDPFSKLAYQVMPIYSFLAARYLLATLFMFAFWGKKIRDELCRVSWRHYIIPCLCMSVAFIVSNTGLKYTSVANVAFIRSLTALVAPLLLCVFFHKKFGARTLLVLVGVAVGLYFLCVENGLGQVGRGEVYAFISTVLVAAALVFGADSLHYISAITLSCIQSFGSIWVCLLAGFANDALASTDWNLLRRPDIGGTLVYAALACTVGGYLLQNVALEYISAKLVGILQCTYPIVTAVVAYVVLGEMLSPLGMLGAALILLCVIIESLGRE
ncbi:MAG: DMT family transporter [Phascolarctobacterium sp.]|uniref:DMT family transporter n=1 Tax=Phascolarctobacterium sp. TaxID=2049039 RepID=UPI0026DB1BFC|nr:DMT family transporter [Phascolarctobacterium sp.]MDO4921444.1 DMT family transporter [Phascolarctobacterium sp.]